MAKSRKPSHNIQFFNVTQNLSLRVQSLRRAKGDTMEQLATACDVTRGTIHKIEHPTPGEDVSLATLFVMAKHFGITLDELFKEIERTESSPSANDPHQNRWFQQEDYLAVTLLPEHHALQLRADLCEQACLHCTDPQQLEVLAKHAAKLRHRRFGLVSKK